MMPAYVFVILLAGWLIWAAPFFLIRKGGKRAATLDRRARWGLLLQSLAFMLPWQTRFWLRIPETWLLVPAIVLLILAALLSWMAVRALGRHWRIDAGLDADHELVRSGVYGVVRHPIYTSMLCMFLGTTIVIAPWWMAIVATLVFVAGTEIRVRIEDALLESRFGEAARSYRKQVPAYVPLVR